MIPLGKVNVGTTDCGAIRFLGNLEYRVGINYFSGVSRKLIQQEMVWLFLLEDSACSGLSVTDKGGSGHGSSRGRHLLLEGLALQRGHGKYGGQETCCGLHL
jgi:hypothetical protein